MQLVRPFLVIAVMIAVAGAFSPAAHAAADITGEEITIMCDPGQMIIDLTADQSLAVRQACAAYENALAVGKLAADERITRSRVPVQKALSACERANDKARTRLCRAAAIAQRRAKRHKKNIILQQLATVDEAKQEFIDALTTAGVFDDEI